MKKNYLLILIFLLLGAGTFWYLNSDSDKGAANTLGWDRKFAVDDINEVHKIFIAKRTGETTTLERNGDHWIYNGQWKASQNAVENVLEVVGDVNLKYVPPAAALENIVKEMAARGIKVEVYNKRGDKLKAYYIGGVTIDVRGTYFIMEDSEQPMAVDIPQMEGQVRTRFELTGDKWRDRAVLDYEPEDIAAVSVEYPKQRNKSFKLTRDGDNYDVQPFYDNQQPLNRKLDKSSVEGFLVGFDNLMAEAINNAYEKKDSIRQTVPFSVVSVTDIKGNEKRVAFYPFYRTDANTGERKADAVERFFADTNTGDWYLTQLRVFKGIFWGYDGFFVPVGNAVKD